MIGYGYKQWACITLNLMEGSDRNNLAATCKNVLRCIYRSREELVHCCTIQLSLSSRGLHGGAYFSDVSG